VTISGGQLIIDAGSYFGTEDYVIGLLCGMGTAPVEADITCTTTGEGLWVSVADGLVTLSDEPVEVAVSDPTVPEETQEA